MGNEATKINPDIFMIALKCTLIHDVLCPEPSSSECPSGSQG
jgi:hypothetical protein